MGKAKKEVKETKVRRLDGHSELMVWNVPNKVKEAFKVKCILQQTTMREAIIDIMTEYAK